MGATTMSYTRYIKKAGEEVGTLEEVIDVYGRDEVLSSRMYDSSLKAIDQYEWDLYRQTGNPNDKPESWGE